MTAAEAIEYMSLTGNPVRCTWFEKDTFIKLYKNDMVICLTKYSACASDVESIQTTEQFKGWVIDYKFEKYEY